MCTKSFVISIVICCITNIVASQQVTNNNSEKSSIIDFILCGLEKNGANCISRLINGFSNDLLIARRHLYVEADRELERNLQARRITVYEVHGYKPSTLMRVLESSFKGVVEMSGGVLKEIWSQPRTSITSRQFGVDEQAFESEGFNEVRGKKKKHKHNLHKGLILNIARFWMDYRRARNPPLYSQPPPQPYSNDQQNTSYDDTNKQPGYYPRSMNKRTYEEQESEAQALAYIGYGAY